MTLSTLRPYFLIFELVLFTAIISGCNSKKDENLVPSYIHIDNITVTTTTPQGSSSSNITDAWVYLNATLIGSFELPATIPLLAEGKHSITIRPGIKLNGISNTRAAYPFYQGLEKEITLVKDSIINITNTVVHYEDNVIFPWIESFESSGISLDTTDKSNVDIGKTNDPDLIFPQNGNSYSAIISMPRDTTIFEAFTNNSFEFPNNGGYVFLELDYKITHPLVVGVSYESSGIRYQKPMVIINKSTDWKKIYINLTVLKYDIPDASKIKLFLGVEKVEDEEAIFLLDNLKLVQFNTTR